MGGVTDLGVGRHVGVDVSVTPATVNAYRRGRLDTRNGPDRLLFGRMYEDAAIEVAAFGAQGRVFCIASAGDTAMALSACHEVVAVDINPVQVAYARRRFAGEALAERGMAERFMSYGRSFAPLVGWWPSRLREFLGMADPVLQTQFWNSQLDTARFRACMNGLFSVKALRALYAPDFLAFLPQQLGSVMRARMARCFGLHANRDNPYARTLLLGELSAARPPASAAKIQLVCADAAEFLEAQQPGSFTGFTLSNILDGADPNYRFRLCEAVRQAAAPGAQTVLRSFREPPTTLPTAAAEPSTSINRAADDRAMLWGRVDVGPATALT
jgi:S-adenosylmethionine:diacylglycerol 3-amino-3-carboxypropyl transferase